MLGMGGTRVAQSFKHLTLDLGSAHNLMVCVFKTRAALCADSMEPVWDSLSLCPSPTHALALSLSLK